MKDNQASATAYSVVQGLLKSAQNPNFKNIISTDAVSASRQILSATDEGQKRLAQLEKSWFLCLTDYAERLLMPGITLHYALRKRYIEDATRKAIDQGVKQIVNLGAGFDTLVWRLHTEDPQLICIELDHPATNAIKKQALVGKEETNLHLLAVDFNKTDARQVLQEFEGFDSSLPTLFICEGVLMYLPNTEVVRLFEGLKALTGSGTQFVFTSVEPMDSPENNTGALLKLFLKYLGEPLNWLMEKTDIASFLEANEYSLLEIASTDELEERYLKGVPHGVLHHGEYLVHSIAK